MESLRAIRLIALTTLVASLAGCSTAPTTTPQTTLSGTDPVVVVTCVPNEAELVPVADGWVRVWTNGSLHVKRGMFVGLEVVEPEGDLTGPPNLARQAIFPWLAPVMMSNEVLRPTRACQQTAIATLPLAVYWFEAIGEGAVTVTVPLSKEWAHTPNACPPALHCAPLQPLQVSITVT